MSKTVKSESSKFHPDNFWQLNDGLFFRNRISNSPINLRIESSTIVTMAQFSFLDHLDIERMWLIDLGTVD